MIGPYVLKRVLGQGSASVVRRAEHKETGQEVAIKIIGKGTNRSKRRKSIKAAREISILRAIDHPNVVKLYRTFESRTHFFLVMELVKGMELFDYLINKGRLDTSEALVIFSQVVKGLMACHERGVVHRDLKAENILLDTQGNVKIVDFELANFVRSAPLKTFCGSSYYAPPEICAGQIYDGEKGDVWSIGVLLYMMLVGEYPFDDANDAVLIKKIMHKELSFPEGIHSNIRDLIQQLLTKDPKQRLPCHRIPHHPCFYVEGRNMYFDVANHPASPHTTRDRRMQVLENLVLELERQLLPEVQMSFANLELADEEDGEERGVETTTKPHPHHQTSHQPPQQRPDLQVPQYQINKQDLGDSKESHAQGASGSGARPRVQISSSSSSSIPAHPLQALASNPDWQQVSHSGSHGSMNSARESGRGSSSDEKRHKGLQTQTRVHPNNPIRGVDQASSRADTAMMEEEEPGSTRPGSDTMAKGRQVGQQASSSSSHVHGGAPRQHRPHPNQTSSSGGGGGGARGTADDPLWWIMYRSQLEVKKAQDPIDMIKKIARDSLHKNRALGIGGMLYCDRKTGRIIQILEGRRSVLKQLAAAIMMDQRHTRFMIIKNEPVPQRRFKDWGMSFANTLSSFQRHRMNPKDRNDIKDSKSNRGDSPGPKTIHPGGGTAGVRITPTPSNIAAAVVASAPPPVLSAAPSLTLTSLPLGSAARVTGPTPSTLQSPPHHDPHHTSPAINEDRLPPSSTPVIASTSLPVEASSTSHRMGEDHKNTYQQQQAVTLVEALGNNVSRMVSDEPSTDPKDRDRGEGRTPKRSKT